MYDPLIFYDIHRVDKSSKKLAKAPEASLLAKYIHFYFGSKDTKRLAKIVMG